MTIVAGLLACLAAASDSGPLPERPVPDLRTGITFQAELDRRISAVWQNVGLRTILRRMAGPRRIAVLLDRRIDPSAGRNLDVSNRSVRSALEDIAAEAGAALSMLDGVVYLGPPDAAARLRTLIQLRTEEALGRDSPAPRPRQVELSARRALHWNDLDEPATLVRRIADGYRLELEGLDQVPHDLWAGATLPAVNAPEALSLVLIQFDLTFAWTDGLTGVRIVPAPPEATIERTYTPRGLTAAAAAERWREQIADLDAEPQGPRVVVRGTAEQHEALAALMRPPRRPVARRDADPDAPLPLDRRLFTLPRQRVSAAALIEKLEASGIDFDYDAAELEAAGIDLATPVTLEARQASAEEFFRLLCEPLGLTFEIDDLTVTLRPQE